MAFTLADLTVSIGADVQGLNTALASVKSQLMGFAGQGAQIGQMIGDSIIAPLFGITDAAAAAGVALKVGLAGAAVVGLTKAAMMASDFVETVTKMEQVFGSSSQGVMAAAQEMADKFGVPRKEFLDAASAFGLITEGAGMAADESAKTGVALARLAADASSFYNMPIDAAFEKIRAGLSGEAEPLRAFSVRLSEDAVKAKALAMGLGRAGQELTESAKIAARVALIQQGLAKADGDLERTGGGAANQMREAWGHLVEIGTSIGIIVLPVFGAILNATNAVLGQIAKLTSRFAGLFEGLKDFLGLGTDAASKAKELADIDARTEDQRQQILQEQANAARKTGSGSHADKGQHMSLEQFARHIQEIGSSKKGTPEKQLAVQQQQLLVQQQQLDATRRQQPGFAIARP